MNIKTLTDKALLASTETLARKEREILSLVLRHLREIERRRLFASLGYSSLFTYCVGRLGYSEDQAYHRISAMRLFRELPEMEGAQISLTNLSLAGSAFRRGKLSREKKIEILRELENKSTREGEKILARHVPRAPKPDRMKPVTENALEVCFQGSPELQEKVEILRGLLAHKHPNISLGELFEKLCDLGIETWDPGRPPKRTARARKAESPAAPRVKSAAQEVTHQVGAPCQAGATHPQNTPPMPPSPAAKQVESKLPHRHVPSQPNPPARVSASLQRLVWQKARNKCENCHSAYALEIDHRVPRALGGSNDAPNLRLLCRSCNQRAAIQTLGLRKMETHLGGRL